MFKRKKGKGRSCCFWSSKDKDFYGEVVVVDILHKMMMMMIITEPLSVGFVRLIPMFL